MLTVVRCVLGIGTTAVCAADLNLVGLLTQDLGVTTEQAEGGAGAILGAASKNMSSDQFTQVTDALPDVASLVKNTSTSDSGSGSSEGLSSLLGNSQSSLSSLAGLTSTFSDLGLSSDMIGKFTSGHIGICPVRGGQRDRQSA